MLINWTGVIVCSLLLAVYLAKHAADQVPARGLGLRLLRARVLLSAHILGAFVLIVKGTRLWSLARFGVFLAAWVAGER